MLNPDRFKSEKFQVHGHDIKIIALPELHLRSSKLKIHIISQLNQYSYQGGQLHEPEQIHSWIWIRIIIKTPAGSKSKLEFNLGTDPYKNHNWVWIRIKFTTESGSVSKSQLSLDPYQIHN